MFFKRRPLSLSTRENTYARHWHELGCAFLPSAFNCGALKQSKNESERERPSARVGERAREISSPLETRASNFLPLSPPSLYLYCFYSRGGRGGVRHSFLTSWQRYRGPNRERERARENRSGNVSTQTLTPIAVCTRRARLDFRAECPRGIWPRWQFCRPQRCAAVLRDKAAGAEGGGNFFFARSTGEPKRRVCMRGIVFARGWRQSWVRSCLSRGRKIWWNRGCGLRGRSSGSELLFVSEVGIEKDESS